MNQPQMFDCFRPQMLDCFAGEGGAAMGYDQAGWSVYCVDNDETRLANNPFPSHCGDVLVVMATLNAGGAVDFTHPDGRVEWKRKADFKAIHGSPTCTGYSRGTTSIPDRFDKYDRFIPVARALFIESGLPYVIENVEDAGDELLEPSLLCGRMFGLGAIDDDGTPLVLDRHRLFESNVALSVPQHRKHSKKPLPGTPPCACGKTHFQVAGLYGGARRDKYAARHVRRGGYVPPNLEVLRALNGTPWTTEKGTFLAIPPVYTRFIGRQLLNHLEVMA